MQFARILLILPVLLSLAAPAARANRYDPLLRFHSLTTPHFVIHYHQGEEVLALRLTVIAEDEYQRLVARLGYAPRNRTHVVLADQDDEPNGLTTVLPYNLIEITASPPSGESYLGNTDDWLRVVFRHEYTHVLHLDPARSWARVVRGVFGRAFFAFPNLTLPEWQIEGLAVFEESVESEGRLAAGDFRDVVLTGARDGRFEPMSRVNGGLIAWPSGTGWYAYGGFFHEYLVRRFGEDRFARLSAHTAGRLPYLSARAFRAEYGVSLGQLWRDFEADMRARLDTSGAPAARRLTHDGYLVDGPRFDRDGTIVYAQSDAHGFPELRRLATDGRSSAVATRYGGRQTAPGADALYFDQLEFVRNAGLQSDLYRVDRTSGRVTRVTSGARLTDPDLSPDGTKLAAIRSGRGSRSLVVLDRSALDQSHGTAEGWAHPLLVTGDDRMVLAAPRWSPDGRSIAFEARRRGGPSEIAVLDVASGATHVVATSPRGRNVTPAWTPDGHFLVFASDRDGGAFALYRVAVNGSGDTPPSAERWLAPAGGARSPDLSPDGRVVVFVGYTADGFDLFSAPLPAPAGSDARPERPDLAADALTPSSQTPDAQPAAAAGAPYRPWKSLLPRAWLPLVDTSNDEVRLGAATAGTDPLGYHVWAASVSWSVARDTALDPVSPGARPDFTVSYAYARWRPTLYAQIEDETTPLLLPSADGSSVAAVALRQRSVDAGAFLPFLRVRHAQQIFGAYHFEHDRAESANAAATLDRGAVRLGYSFANAKRYGYSISRESGVTAGLVSELGGTALGGDGTSTLVRTDVRGFVPLGPRHAMLALRGSAAASGGDVAIRRTLRLGGADGDASVVSFDDDGTSLLRGFPSNAFRGTRVGLVNVEYRIPIVWIERGRGTWPAFVRNVHVAPFVDAGDAWTRTGRRTDGARFTVETFGQYYAHDWVHHLHDVGGDVRP